MESNWAEENLKTIRTLMERSALYRRALAPIMTYVGSIGIIAAIVGWSWKIRSPIGFVVFWFVAAAVALVGTFLLVRKQAFQASEPFWSPPTRRISRAIFPPLMAGFILGVIVFIESNMSVWSALPDKLFTPTWGMMALLPLGWLPLIWIILYGCALHSAGFFVARGIRIFGLAIVIGGCLMFWVSTRFDQSELIHFSYAVMGFFFGVLHLAYGIYLYFTEKRRNET